MIITYYGASCFKVQSGETVIAFNPPSKNSEFKSPRFQTDIVLISCEEKDYNGREALSSKKENTEPFIIDTPGEYEIGGIYVKGLPTYNKEKQLEMNTVFSVNFEDISVCHLGNFKEDSVLTPEMIEEIGEVDILFIPVKENNAQIMRKISSEIEPKIVIPMHFKETELKKFLKEFGAEDIKSAEKLTIKKKDLKDGATEVVILDSN